MKPKVDSISYFTLKRQSKSVENQFNQFDTNKSKIDIEARLKTLHELAV